MDFGQRISDAQGNVNTSKNTYNEYAQQANQAGGKFDDAFDSRQNYGDIYGQARDQYYNTDEINAARDTYQNARGAVDQLNTTINKMPESIRQQYGGTGLTEAQRQRALSDQYSQNANTYNMLNTNYSNASSDYNDLAARAMQEVQNVAGGNYQSQEDALNSLQGAWNTLLGQRNTAYSQNQTDRGLLGEQYGARDQNAMFNQELEFKRWQEQQANARAAADRASQMDLQKYLTASQERIAGLNQPAAPSYNPVSTPKSNSPQGNKNVVDDGGLWGLIKQGGQNVMDYGPLALFGGGSLWR